MLTSDGENNRQSGFIYKLNVTNAGRAETCYQVNDQAKYSMIQLYKRLLIIFSADRSSGSANVCSFVHWFVCSLVHSFICLFVCLLVCLFVCLFVRLFVHLFVCLLIQFICSFVCLFVWSKLVWSS